MAAWARGIEFKDNSGSKVLGGVGLYGDGTTSQKVYLGYGDNYWSTGVTISKTEFKYNNNKVYHQGFKPTAAEIGALSSSTNVTSMAGYSGSQPFYNPDSKGILITTNIPTGSQTMVELRITGNSYGAGDPIDTFINLYVFNANQIINCSANAYGAKFDIKAFYHNGYFKLHIPYMAIYQTFRVDLKTSNSYMNTAKATLTNEAIPSSGVTSLVTITPKIYYSERRKPTPSDIGAATSSHTHSNYMQQGTLSSSHNLDNLNLNAIYTNPANANATTANKYPIAEAGSLLTGIASYGSSNQMYQTFSSNRLFIRGGGSSTTSKTAWAEVYTTVKKPTPAEIGAAASSHSHDWNSITGKPGSFFTARNGTVASYNDKSDGAWTFTNYTTDKPSNLEYEYGVILNFKSYDNTSYGGGSILISHSGSRDLMFRGMYGGDNQPWRKVWHDGNFNATNPAVSSLVSTGAITGGTGSTFHGESWFANVNLQEIKPNGARWISMISADRTLGTYFATKSSYGQSDIHINGNGLINGAYHSLIFPANGNYAFCGGAEQYFTSMYARAFLTKSDKNIKTKITKYESQNILDDVLDLTTYQYNTLAQATREGIVENKNDINLGIMVQNAPIEIIDESETAINVYAYATYILKGLQEEIKERRSNEEKLERRIAKLEE